MVIISLPEYFELSKKLKFLNLVHWFTSIVIFSLAVGVEKLLSL